MVGRVGLIGWLVGWGGVYVCGWGGWRVGVSERLPGRCRPAARTVFFILKNVQREIYIFKKMGAGG